MADDQDRAFIVGDHFLQQVERLQVEVVGRLVEHQQVRLARKLPRQQQARPLAARQRPDRRFGQLGREQEFLQIALDVLLRAANVDPVAAFRKHVANALGRLHQLALLVDDDAGQRLGALDLALVGLELAGQQLEQGRLARAVGADDADPVAALDAQGEVADDRALAEALRHVVRLDHRLGPNVVLGDGELGGARGRRSSRPAAPASRAAWRGGPGCGGGAR